MLVARVIVAVAAVVFEVLAEVVVVMEQSRDRFVDEVAYTTSDGKRVSVLVSTMGVFEKLAGEDDFTLTGYFPDRALSEPEDTIRRIKDNCGWELKISPQVTRVPEPSLDELVQLRLIDSKGKFTGSD